MSVKVNDVFAMWPGWNRISGRVRMGSGPTVDDESEKVCVVLQAPRTGSIEYVGLGIYAVATFPTANIDIRVETVNTSTGEPTGTLFGSNTNWSGTYSTGAYSIVRWGPLTSNASVSKGDFFAIVYVPPSNPDAGDVDFYGVEDETYGFPYSKFYNGASWDALNRIGVCLWYTDGYAVIPSVAQVGKMPAMLWNNSDTYDHVGNELKSNVACEVVGMWAALNTGSNDTDLKLISGDDQVERTVTLEADYRGHATWQILRYGYFSSPFTIQKDVLYRYAAYTAENTDIAMTTYNVFHTGDTANEMTQQVPNNWFYDIDLVEGELTTPAWRGHAEFPRNWGLIGPIVRSIG